ncbi:MAG: PAS domain S-box protein [Gammaproteobacteria bacterium]|nr:PAS domain S-box protein [Gammaproteobacteria bacterium]MDH5801872.1 PAS domain S-box protein [Gammaproteobacteria bacterium]
MKHPKVLNSFTLNIIAVIILTTGLSAAVVQFGNHLNAHLKKVEQWHRVYQQMHTTLKHLEDHFSHGNNSQPGFLQFFEQLEQGDTSVVAAAQKQLNIVFRDVETLKTLEHDHHETQEQLKAFHTVLQLYAKRLTITATNSAIEQKTFGSGPGMMAIHALNRHYSESEDTQHNQMLFEELRSMSGSIFALVPIVIAIAFIILVGLRKLFYTHKLLDNQNQYTTDLLESVPNPLFIVNTEGKILQANYQATQLFAYHKDEIIGMEIECLIPERFRQNHGQWRQNAFHSATNRSKNDLKEFSALLSDGTEIPVHISLSFSKHNGITTGIVSLRDISQLKQAEQDLKNQADMLNKAQQLTHLGSWVQDLNNNTVSWSEELHRILGTHPDTTEPSMQAFYQQVADSDKNRVQNEIGSALANRCGFTLEHSIVRPNGRERIVKISGQVYADVNGHAQRLVGTVRDITERRHTEEKLRMAKVVFDNSQEAITVLDAYGSILDSNTAFCKLTGYTRKELISHVPLMFSSKNHNQDFIEHLWPTITAHTQWQGEIWSRHKDGGAKPCQTSVSAVLNSKGEITHYAMIILDISTLKENQEKLEQLAHFDQLTNLANRFLFHDRLRTALQRADRKQLLFAVLYIDLDGFKKVNDDLGHAAGDEVLIDMAQKIQNQVRSDDTVARLGGDEFAVILHELASLSEINSIVARLSQNLHARKESGTQVLEVTASIGVAIYPDDGTTGESLLQHADQAMYHAKKLGKNTHCFFHREERKSS